MVTRLLRLRSFCFIVLLLLVCTTAPVAAQSTTFTYQGQLADNGIPADGQYDFQFGLWNSMFDGASVAPRNTRLGVTVTNGSFTVALDFGASAFPGADRYLEIAVRPANTGSYTTLTPRQIITSSPYAIQTLNAQQLGGLPATRYVVTDVNGNAGIGTATPSTKLEVVDPVRQLRFGPTTADNGGYLISTVPHQAIIAGGAKWDVPN